MSRLPRDLKPDLIETIPEPDILNQWLAEALRRVDLLRSLLRVARRKAAYRRPSIEREASQKKS